jgi:hypothetical protein
VCNGHTDPARGYHYHVTPGRFPYIIGGYAGTPDPTNSPLLRRAAAGAITDNADRSGTREFGIRSVTPGSASRGKTHTLRFVLDPATRGGLPQGVPNWVQVGPFEASKITRQDDTILAEIAIASDAPLGVLLDAHIEFGKPRSGLVRVLKKNDALRVVP